MLFNVNDHVRVKLTPFGREAYRDAHAETARILGYPVRDKAVDAEGWSEFQLHELMNIFGKHCYNGATQLPFATTIDIEVRAEGPESWRDRPPLL